MIQILSKSFIRFRRFALTGVASTAIHVLFALAMIEILGAGPTVANIFAFSVSTVFAYFVNTQWSFATKVTGTNITRYLCVAVLGLLATIAISTLFETLSLHYYMGIFAIVVVVPMISFLSHLFWTYRDGSDPENPMSG